MLHHWRSISFSAELRLTFTCVLLHGLWFEVWWPWSRSCPGVNSLLGVQYQASGEAWQIFPCHITKKAFLSFYRVTNVAQVFSDIFAVLELPNGKPNDQQAEAMQTVWSVRVSASSNKLCCAGLAALCCSGRTSGQLQFSVRPKQHQNSYSTI